MKATHPNDISYDALTKSQLKKVRKQIHDLYELLNELEPYLDVLLGDGNTRHLTHEQKRMYDLITHSHNMAVCDVLTAAELAEAYNNHYNTSVSTTVNEITAHTAGHILKRLACYTKRQVSSANGSARVWILRNFDEHGGASGLDLTAYRNETLLAYQQRELMGMNPEDKQHTVADSASIDFL